jgi:hypothetical protein
VGAGSIGAGFASFLLEQVTSINVNAPKLTQMRKKTWSLYLHDNWKITRNPTLDYGLRWDLEPIGHELYYWESEIGLHTPNPAAGGLPGGYIYEGNGPGRCNCLFTHTYPFAIGPRLALAYQINPKTVLRAGWGVSYSAGPNWAHINAGAPTAGLGMNAVTASGSRAAAKVWDSTLADVIQASRKPAAVRSLAESCRVLHGRHSATWFYCKQKEEHGGRDRTRTCDLLRVKRGVHSTLLIVLAV